MELLEYPGKNSAWTLSNILISIDIATIGVKLAWMKAYSEDLRARIVRYVTQGGSKPEAAQRFGVHRATVYRYLRLAQAQRLAPKTSWGRWRKLDPERLRASVAAQPDATLAELGDQLGVSVGTVWWRLRRLKITLKKSHALSGARRGAALAVPAVAGRTGRGAGVLSGRKRRGTAAAP
jgi:transposase